MTGIKANQKPTSKGGGRAVLGARHRAPAFATTLAVDLGLRSLLWLGVILVAATCFLTVQARLARALLLREMSS